MSQLAVTSTPSHPRPLVFHRDPQARPAEGSQSHWFSGVGLQEGCTGGSETGLGEEVPPSRGNGTFKGPEARGKQHRVRLEPGSLGTQSLGRVQGDPPPLGHQQSLVPLGKSDISWGSLCPVGISGPTLSACQVTSKCFQGLGSAMVRGAGIQARERPRTFRFDQVLPSGRVPRRCEGPGSLGPLPPTCH